MNLVIGLMSLLLSEGGIVLTNYEQITHIAQSVQSNTLENAQWLDQRVFEYYINEQYSEAIPLTKESLRIRRTLLKPQDLRIAISLSYLIALYDAQGRYAETETLLIESKDIIVRSLGKENRYYINSLNKLAELYRAQGRYDEAEPLLIEARTINAKTSGKENSEEDEGSH